MSFNKISSEVIELVLDNYISSTVKAGSSVSDLGYRVYADTAGVAPVDGNGGTPGVTLSVNTSSPLSGTGDLRLVKDAVNRQGNGFSTDFSVANRHLGKVLQVTFDMELISGTYSRGDLRVSVIQDPSGTPVLIEPVNTQIELGVANQRLRHVASFQTSTTVNSYRLCVHIGSASTVAYTVDFANFKVWEPIQSIGAVITDWQSYTPTFTGWGTQSGVNAYWRRVGGTLELDLRYTYASTTAVEARISLPSGLVSSSNISTIQIAGTSMLFSVVTATEWFPLIEPNVSYLTFGRQSGITAGLTKVNGNIFSNATISFKCFIPIAGWGSSVAMSSDTGDGRVVAARYIGSATTNPSIANGIESFVTFSTRETDTHNSFSTGSGVYTIPISGYYRVNVRVGLTGTYGNNLANILRVYKGNSMVSDTIFIGAGNGAVRGFLSDTLFFNAGETVRAAIVPASWSSVSLDNSANSVNSFSIERISTGSQVIATAETVACRYEKTDGANILSSLTDVIYNLRIRDTHNAYNTITGEYTIPISGYYQINCIVGLSTGSLYNIQVFKNGSVTDITTVEGVTTMNRRNLSTGNYYLAGDKIKIQALADTTRSTDTQAGANTLFICRLGI